MKRTHVGSCGFHTSSIRLLGVVGIAGGLALGAAGARFDVSAFSLGVPVEPGECWYGAATVFGRDVPFGAESAAKSFDLRSSNYSNQTLTKIKWQLWSDLAKTQHELWLILSKTQDLRGIGMEITACRSSRRRLVWVVV